MSEPAVTVLRLAADGPPVRGERDATDLIGDAFAVGAAWVVVPVERFEDDFFRLSTRVAGGIVQKFATYRIGLAVVGDISRHTADSGPLRDFVRESNRGGQLWFLADEAAFEARFDAPPGTRSEVRSEVRP
ncbi:DUF4180 domain-containing protein [Kitasatospora sp. NPDC050463]|uniref:DUF4180 domain-containing protein n=1 Tax=Kitasatospora sp. NPDC050463 TaxID=3155786 RepID=UPI0033CC6766